MQPKNDRTKKKAIHSSGPLSTMYERDGYHTRWVLVTDQLAYDRATSCGYKSVIRPEDYESNNERDVSFQSKYIEKAAGKSVNDGKLRLMEISEEDYQAMCQAQTDNYQDELMKLKQSLTPNVGSLTIEHKQ